MLSNIPGLRVRFWVQADFLQRKVSSRGWVVCWWLIPVSVVSGSREHLFAIVSGWDSSQREFFFGRSLQMCPILLHSLQWVDLCDFTCLRRWVVIEHSLRVIKVKWDSHYSHFWKFKSRRDIFWKGRDHGMSDRDGQRCRRQGEQRWMCSWDKMRRGEKRILEAGGLRKTLVPISLCSWIRWVSGHWVSPLTYLNSCSG